RYHVKPVLEEPRHIRARDDAPEERQVRLTLEPVQQNAERLPERVVTEVVELRRAGGTPQQIVSVEVEERTPDPANRRAGPVENAKRERTRWKIGHERRQSSTGGGRR